MNARTEGSHGPLEPSESGTAVTAVPLDCTWPMYIAGVAPAVSERHYESGQSSVGNNATCSTPEQVVSTSLNPRGACDDNDSHKAAQMQALRLRLLTRKNTTGPGELASRK